MTPAKLLYLTDKRMAKLEQEELPLANFMCLYANAHRGTGDPEKGIAPDPPFELDSFRVFKRRVSLAAKLDSSNILQPGGPHNYMGAQADRGAFEAWGRGMQQRAKIRS